MRLDLAREAVCHKGADESLVCGLYDVKRHASHRPPSGIPDAARHWPSMVPRHADKKWEWENVLVAGCNGAGSTGPV